MDKKHPIRRKHVDNPYTLKLHNGTPYLLFKDGQGINQTLELTAELYEAFSEFEIEDETHYKRDYRHINRNICSEDAMEKFDYFSAPSAEEIALKNLFNEMILSALMELSEIQRRRLVLRYYYGYSLQAIADMEGRTIMPIKRSIEEAKEKLTKFF